MKAKAPKRKIFDAVDMLTGDSPAQTTETAAGGVQMLPVDVIKPFRDHPFRLYEGERLEDMIESIREHGILSPVIVRKKGDEYEMLAGHNRLNAAKIAGLKEIPAIIKEGLSEEEAYVYVIETNLIQRSFSELLPSERAVVLSDRYNRICSQGKRNDIRREIEILNGLEPTCGRNVHKLKTRDCIGEEYGMTGRNIARYMRLNNLIDPLKELVDLGEIALMSAVDLSYLAENEQKMLSDQMQWGNARVTQRTAKLLRENIGKMDEESMAGILNPTAGAAKTMSIKIPAETGERYFAGKTAKERTDLVVQALEAWFEGKEAV